MKTNKRILQDLAQVFLFRTITVFSVLAIFVALVMLSSSYKKQDTKEMIASQKSEMLPQSISEQKRGHHFFDVPKEHPYKQAVEYSYRNGIVRGFHNGTIFQPEEYISRAELVTILGKVFFDEAETQECLEKFNTNGISLYFFPDVPADSWFTAPVCVANKNGIIKGYPDGYFRPHQRVSFAESAKIFAKLLDLEKSKPSDEKWYEGAIRGLGEQNAIPTSISAVDDPITRAEFVEILYRLLEKKSNRASFALSDFIMHASAPECMDCLLIPKLDIRVPIIYGVAEESFQNQQWRRFENEILTALRDGVVHYPNTALPGMIGNVFLSGHSSYYQSDPGKYKDVFAKLGELETGDEYTIYYQGKRFVYKIREHKIIEPNDFSVLSPPTEKELSTLMTCYPVYTNKQRKIFVAERVM
jgi:LPXTG-site transpeptidase (sortase) family protein